MSGPECPPSEVGQVAFPPEESQSRSKAETKATKILVRSHYMRSLRAPQPASSGATPLVKWIAAALSRCPNRFRVAWSPTIIRPFSRPETTSPNAQEPKRSRLGIHMGSNGEVEGPRVGAGRTRVEPSSSVDPESGRTGAAGAHCLPAPAATLPNTPHGPLQRLLGVGNLPLACHSALRGRRLAEIAFITVVSGGARLNVTRLRGQRSLYKRLNRLGPEGSERNQPNGFALQDRCLQASPWVFIGGLAPFAKNNVTHFAG